MSEKIKSVSEQMQDELEPLPGPTAKSIEDAATEEKNDYVPVDVEKLEYPLEEISNILNQIDHLCYDVQRIETHLSKKFSLSKQMIRQIAVEWHDRDFAATISELSLLHREHLLMKNPASIINPIDIVKKEFI
jgi:hypothetical protein